MESNVNITNDETNLVEYEVTDIKNILQSFVKKRINILTETQPVIASVWTHYMQMYIERITNNLSQLNDIVNSNNLEEGINEETLLMAYILLQNSL